MKPFQDDETTIGIGDLSIENGKERIAVHGSLDIPRTAVGLDRARRLRDQLDTIVLALEAGNLLQEEPTVIAARTIRNPLLRD